MNKQTNENMPTDSELGKKTIYEDTYNPTRLFMISRIEKREEIGIHSSNLPFKGFDCWNHYEVSWLNSKGKPVVGIAEIIYDCHSPFIVESKSLKLYFNSLNNTHFSTIEDVENVIRKDLEAGLKCDVWVKINPISNKDNLLWAASFEGESLDELDITCSIYTVEPSYLFVEEPIVEEVLYSDLLKSNCLVTNQPDWGSVQISYCGKKINREGLLKYLVSFRNHNEFHEQCIERIFMDLLTICKPQSLTVYGRYTRRGGLDINPFRSTEAVERAKISHRLIRQ